MSRGCAVMLALIGGLIGTLVLLSTAWDIWDWAVAG